MSTVSCSPRRRDLAGGGRRACLYVRNVASRQAEIGWGVDANHGGRGLATEIGRAMIGYAFSTLGMHRAFAQCRVENQASRRIMAKLGIREEGVLREKRVRARRMVVVGAMLDPVE